MSVRVVVAEDQVLVRAGLVSILGSTDDIDVVAEVGDGDAALQAVAAHRPDLVLMDVRMPQCDGITATERVVAQHRDTRVLVLTTFGQDDVVVDALQAGASGFLLKDTRPEDLIEAVRAVAAGESRVDAAVMSALVARIRGARPRRDHPVEQLTERELEILQLMARGLSNAEIADALVVSTGTVKTHVAAVLAKLAVRDRVQAVIAAFESGVVA